MYFSNGFVYGGTPTELMKIAKVKPLDNMMLLLTFSSGELRLYDASQLLKYKIFQPLKDKYSLIQSLSMVWSHGLLGSLMSLLNLCMRIAIHM